MGAISDEQVEWAVVNRLKAMLDDPPKTKFNVTQCFAHFTTILLWTKNRAWVGGYREDRPDWFDEADHAAHNARERLRDARICDDPWRLSRIRPQIVMVDPDREPPRLALIGSRFVFDLSLNRINEDRDKEHDRAKPPSAEIHIGFHL